MQRDRADRVRPAVSTRRLLAVLRVLDKRTRGSYSLGHVQETVRAATEIHDVPRRHSTWLYGAEGPASARYFSPGLYVALSEQLL